MNDQPVTDPFWTPSLLLDSDFDNEPLDVEYEHLAQRNDQTGE